jgi:hypothetical protein
MADVFHFVPKSELDAKLNLEYFMCKCRDELTVFGKELDWSSWKWPRAGNFTKTGAHSQTKDLADQMDENFIDFAKAYFRYQQGHHPTGTKNELKALRGIETALIQITGSAYIHELSVTVLDEAAQIIRGHYSAGAAYHGGRELERLARFVTSKQLVACDLSNWKSPISRKRDEIQTGAVAKERREKKMPTEEALNALAEIFANNPSEPRDIFISSTFAMLMCAPSRITEVLELPVDCEVEEKDSKGVMRYGWRFYSGKGYGADIKWIPTEMVGIAKEAVIRITELTAESRRVANWVEKNPAKFYRHANCPNVADDQLLTAVQVCQALGLVCNTKHKAQSSLTPMKFEKKDLTYTLNDLWQYALSRQPENFPWLCKEKNIKYSNALFCMTKNLIGSQRGTSPVIPWAPSNNVFNYDLSPRESLKDISHKSIFDRHGYLTQDGQRIKLTSHQARHLLNTMAQRGGLSQLAIAKWSGRADPNQNRTYNHMSEYEMVARAEELDTSLTLFGPSGEVGMHIPISIQEFNTLEKGAVHVTEFGVCVHDFTMTPCDKFRDCLNCAEQVCIKGETEKFERIKKRLEEVKAQFSAAEKAMKDGYAGADRWYEYHKNTLTHLEQLVSILENPDIQVGAQIKLRNSKAFSPLRRAVESKLSKGTRSRDTLILKDMTKLLGGGLG